MDIMNMDIRRGDIFFANLGSGVGSEQQGWRPLLVIGSPLGCKNSPVLIVASITSSMSKATLPTHVLLDREIGLEKTSIALLEQPISFDRKRLMEKGTRYIGRLRRDKLKEINEALEVSLGLSNAREKEALKQLEAVTKAEYHYEELKTYGNIPTSIVTQAQIKFEYEYRKLENICALNRLYVDNYYKNKASSIQYSKVTKNNVHSINDRGSIKIAL